MKSLTLWLSCAMSIGAGSLYSQQVVFPLHVGDRWEFSPVGSSSLSRVSIQGDTVMLNGERYAVFAVFERNPPGETWPYDYTYLRQAGNDVFHYNPASQSEEILYRFDASPGDTLLKVPTTHDTVAIIFHRQSSEPFLGAQRRHWHFGVYSMSSPDVGESRRITDSLGLTDVSEANGWSTVHGAQIHGKSYGDISAVPEGIPLPGHPTLYQNYPNPFNPGTTIKYGLPGRSHVTLTIFNTLGQQVATLVDGETEARYHEVKFDASRLPSGVYLYRFQAGDRIEVRKALLMK